MWGGNRNMKKYVITHNSVEGFHYYPDAPKFCEYLQHNHRHMFEIRCKIEVSYNNREVEINEMQRKIKDELNRRFGNPCDFKSYSCEDIAEYLLDKYDNMKSVQVLEDGYGGAEITR